MTSNTIKLYQTVVTGAGQEYTDNLPDKKNWVDFATNRFHDCDELFGYVDATSQITDYLEKAITNSSNQTIEEFKKQLQSFCESRRAFVHSVKSVPSPGDFWR